MALVKCPECKHENVSDKAEKCPHCGFKIAQFIREKTQNNLFDENISRRLSEAEAKRERILSRLKQQRNEELKYKIFWFAWAIIWTIIVVWSFSVSEHGSHGLLIVISLFFSVVGWGGIYLCRGSLEQMNDDLRIAEKDISEYEKIIQGRIDAHKQRMIAEANALQQEKEYAEYTQTSGQAWTVRYFTDPCPYCGHYKVRYSKWEDKRYSIAFWGIASSKIGQNFKCENCKRMW
ncbi:MAG: zinc ribbon domain-containing protein [Eubacteriales bacterium]|nr:zinc ribbon domain-containing protein [Eubacteriales bacterium]